ncbi:MAG: universal stress protein, partial [Methanophagales archaeon]|nr:universal stress protein [Methanophagales archaeon]
PDCIIIDHEELGILDKLFNRSVVLKLIKCASCPVLVARTFRYYERVLALLDSSDVSASVGRHAVQIAHSCGAELHLLILEVVPGELIDGIKKMGEKGNVRIIENWVQGNPMIEAVKEVKSGKYELAVIPWRGTGVIRSDLIGKIVNDAPCSVLTVV